jgi:hypothetical protein
MDRMRKDIQMKTGILVLLVIAFAFPLAAAASERTWEVMPYVWFTGINATMTIQNEPQRIDAGIADVWDNRNAGGSLRCETWRNGRGVYADLFYVNLTNESVIQEERYIPALNIFFLDLAYARQIGATSVFIEQRDWQNLEVSYFSFGALVGGRYFHLVNSIEHTSVETRRQTGWFVDPIVGGYFRYTMTEAMVLAGAGDIGGFHIGSTFTWNAWLRLDIRPVDWLWVNALYRWFDTEYADGSGMTRMGLDGRISGPALGAVLRF